MAEMNNKNYTEVLIGGKIYTLGGLEEENYLQQVASYLNEKIVQVRTIDGFTRLPDDYKNLTLCLNIADDYFKEREHSHVLASQKEELEKEVYRLKAELVNAKVRAKSQAAGNPRADRSPEDEKKA